MHVIATLMRLGWKKRTTTPLRSKQRRMLTLIMIIKEQPKVNAYKKFKHQTIVENQL
jgi:hypothetical protein